MTIKIKKGSSKKRIEELLKKVRSRRSLNAKKYCGTIKLKEDPLTIQKKLRDEWQ